MLDPRDSATTEYYCPDTAVQRLAVQPPHARYRIPHHQARKQDDTRDRAEGVRLDALVMRRADWARPTHPAAHTRPPHAPVHTTLRAR